MEIRKADSKGRVTGFEPGAYYNLFETEDGFQVVRLSEGGYLQGLPTQVTLNPGENILPRNWVIN